MSDREHASRVGPEASGGDALGAAGKRSRVVQRWTAGRGAGPVGLAPDGAVAAQGGGEVGDATAGDDQRAHDFGYGLIARGDHR